MKSNIRKILREEFIRENRIKLNVPVPEDIKQIKDVFVKNGHKLFIVGGAVRDALLGKTPKDYLVNLLNFYQFPYIYIKRILWKKNFTYMFI